MFAEGIKKRAWISEISNELSSKGTMIGRVEEEMDQF